MACVVLYDASVLYPSTLRDLLIRVAQAGLVQAKWTDQILDEVLRNLQKNRPDIPPEKLDRLRKLMLASVRDCLVTGYEPLIGALQLPDPDDRHVLAAAIRARAQVIVTANLRDFPRETLKSWDIEAKSPDDFVVDQHPSGPEGRLGLRPADCRRLAQSSWYGQRRPGPAGAQRTGPGCGGAPFGVEATITVAGPQPRAERVAPMLAAGKEKLRKLCCVFFVCCG